MIFVAGGASFFDGNFMLDYLTIHAEYILNIYSRERGWKLVVTVEPGIAMARSSSYLQWSESYI